MMAPVSLSPVSVLPVSVLPASVSPAGTPRRDAPHPQGSLRRSPLTFALSLIFVLVLVLSTGCQRQSQQAPTAPSLLITFETQPSPPKRGPGQVVVRVQNPNQTPVLNAGVEVEGTMAHAGMKSSFATLTEVSPGRYAGTLDWTMGGDWIAIVRVTPAHAPAGEAPDSASAVIEQRFDVRGVSSGE